MVDAPSYSNLRRKIEKKERRRKKRIFIILAVCSGLVCFCPFSFFSFFPLRPIEIISNPLSTSPISLTHSTTTYYYHHFSDF